MSTALVSAVVVTHASARTLEACLGSLSEEGRRTPLEVTVVDNASPDDTVALVRARHPEVRLLALRENTGFGAACNRGARASRATGGSLLFLNPDARLRPSSVVTLGRALDHDPSLAIAGPRIVDQQGVPELSFGSFPNPLTELRHKLLTRLHARRLAPIEAWIRRRHARHRYPDWVSGACLLVRRADFDLVGGFDERFFLYFEDVDLCARLRARGRDVLYEPRAEVVHLGGRSGTHQPELVRDAYRRSQLHYYTTHGGPEMVALLGALVPAVRALAGKAAGPGDMT